MSTLAGVETARRAVEVATAAFDADLERLTGELGYRLDAIFPADEPSTAIVSRGVTTLALRADDSARPMPLGPAELATGPLVDVAALVPSGAIPENRPSLVVSRDDGASGAGRAGMRYRDLLPDRWGGRFIASHISIPDGGPVPDYVHHHRVRFQMIFVKAGWVEVVYEDQGAPFVMRAGDGVLQPPGIRHRVLSSSPGLEVIEVGCPAEHPTFVDHELELPNGVGDPARTWDGQRFVRHVAPGATYGSWRAPGWECRDTGIGEATDGLAGARVARPTAGGDGDRFQTGSMTLDTEFALLVVLAGRVGFVAPDREIERLGPGASVAIPGGLRHRLVEPSDDCELLDVTLPATVTAT